MFIPGKGKPVTIKTTAFGQTHTREIPTDLLTGVRVLRVNEGMTKPKEGSANPSQPFKTIWFRQRTSRRPSAPGVPSSALPGGERHIITFGDDVVLFKDVKENDVLNVSVSRMGFNGYRANAAEIVPPAIAAAVLQEENKVGEEA